MPEATIRRTYPCGHQESIHVKGWNVWVSGIREDKTPPCPLHGVECHRGH